MQIEIISSDTEILFGHEQWKIIIEIIFDSQGIPYMNSFYEAK